MTQTIAISLLGLALGLGVGLVHFMTLRRVTDLYLDGRATGRAIGLQLLRLLAMAALMVVLALQGAAPLLAGAAGLLIARGIVLRRNRTEG
ncbi:ATP synthase subunit I [Marinibacterium sp. SX1]|uniref:N-ATPase subunit AtpR n=1 Tax=Marinibacterium sp. SX1 TaxID=3388424 RepID=UPI003D16B702